jgi:hypothetical protein
MKITSQFLALALIAQYGFVLAKGNADTIFYGGPVVTVNAKNEEVQAIAVQGGKIVALGTKDAITKDWQSKTTQVIDLKGQTLMPGFVEPHVHIMITAVFEGLGLNLSNFTLPYDTKETLIAKMKAHLKTIPPGGWLFGSGVDPSRTSPFIRYQPQSPFFSSISPAILVTLITKQSSWRALLIKHPILLMVVSM